MFRIIRHYFFIIVSLLGLSLAGFSFAVDSTSIQKAHLIAQKQEPRTVTSGAQDTLKVTSTSPYSGGKLSCPTGYALTAANVGQNYYWNPKANSSISYSCDSTCNGIELGCGCGRLHCPSGCFAGCTNDCTRSSTSYSGGWVPSKTMLPNQSSDMQATSYTCNKIENVWVKS
ncbi:hypothetical protein [Aquicella lusitana]|uniref:Uncharacterized protein n=1 Tax=Aquicella lusitana TaxID=254246 RepID=A0A370GFZ9_9COXI|nr:hypothetical protein [Aquicella lusitana]RDI41314.1 hypothetical protein C8D86_12014 [Aquicella lusitana]VVC72319.1 hypothetical protein AQULUS_00290 [Aquicella lusitana]